MCPKGLSCPKGTQERLLASLHKSTTHELMAWPTSEFDILRTCMLGRHSHPWKRAITLQKIPHKSVVLTIWKCLRFSNQVTMIGGWVCALNCLGLHDISSSFSLHLDSKSSCPHFDNEVWVLMWKATSKKTVEKQKSDHLGAFSHWLLFGNLEKITVAKFIANSVITVIWCVGRMTSMQIWWISYKTSCLEFGGVPNDYYERSIPKITWVW